MCAALPFGFGVCGFCGDGIEGMECHVTQGRLCVFGLGAEVFEIVGALGTVAVEVGFGQAAELAVEGGEFAEVALAVSMFP